MGLLGDIKDDLFGGVDDSAQKKTIKDNARRQEFIEKQAAQGRSDVTTLQPLVDQSLEGGYQSALDMLGGTARAGVNTYGHGNYLAQEALLAGLPQYQNAILGLPVNNQALQATKFNPSPFLDFLYNPQLPDLGLPENYETLLGGGTPGQELASYVQPGMSNRSLVAKANSIGAITPDEYSHLQQYFSESPNAGGSQYWSSAGSADPLVNAISGNAGPGHRQVLENFFNLLYPNG